MGSNDSAANPMRSSARPYQKSGRRVRSARRPPTRLPAARPPMKVARMIETPYMSLPKKSPRLRIHSTW